MSKGLDRSLLLKELKTAFPDLKDDLNAERGQLAFEVEAFYRFTQNMINTGDENAVATCFAIAEKFFLKGNHKVRDAIDTCYVENLDFNNTRTCSRRWAWSIFPNSLRKLYNDFYQFGDQS